MKKAYLLAGVALIGFASIASVPVAAETLDEVLAAAYGTNPTLLARRAQLRATDEEVPQALSKWRPTVTFTEEVGRGRYETNSNTGATAQGREQGRTSDDKTLTVTQYLYRGGKTVAGTRQAEADVLAGRADLQSKEQTILLTAATAFLDVVRDESVLKLNINNEQVLRRQLEAAQERFRVGEITRTDVSQAEARLSGAVAERAAAEGAVQNSRAKFITVIGRAPESPQAPQSLTQVPASFEEIKAVALAKNPTVIYSDWTAQAAKDGIDKARGDLLPEVTLNGELSRKLSTSTQGSELETAEATIKVKVPLYEAGEYYSKLRESKHTYGRRKIEADQARRDALESATKGWEDLQAARARISSIQAQIRASEMALAGVEEEAKVGSRTVLDVLDAEQELFLARVNLVRAQRDQQVSAFTLKSALGEMTASALALNVEVYDPTKNFDDVRYQWIGSGVHQKYED
jgi:outer membrane protein